MEHTKGSVLESKLKETKLLYPVCTIFVNKNLYKEINFWDTADQQRDADLNYS